jgi:hypothetical protein
VGLATIYEENSTGRPTRLFTSLDSSDSPITFIIWGEKRKTFDYKPEKDLKEREVCMTGKIELLKGNFLPLGEPTSTPVSAAKTLFKKTVFDF